MRRLLVLAVAAAAFVPAALQAADKKIRLVNRTSEEILYAFARNPGEIFWGRDLLREPVGRGRATAIVVRDVTQCERDLRVLTRSGRAAERAKADVCAMTEWKIEDKDLR